MVAEEKTTLNKMNCKKRKNKTNLITPISNHDTFIGGPHGGYNNELTIFHLNIQKNMLKADKFEIIESYAKSGADVIFIYEPGIEDIDHFPRDKFYNYDFTPINKKYLIVLTKTSSKLAVEEVVTTEATIMAKVTGRQLTVLGTYNRRSRDRVGTETLDVYKHEERFNNLRIALTKGLHNACKKCVLGGDFNLDLSQTGQKKQANGIKFFLKKRGFTLDNFDYTRRPQKAGESHTRPDWVAHRAFPGAVTDTFYEPLSDHDLCYFANSRKVELEKRISQTIEIWKFGREAEEAAKKFSPRLNYIENFESLTVTELTILLQEYLNKINEVCKKIIKVKRWGLPYYNERLVEEKRRIQECTDKIKRKLLYAAHKTNLKIARRNWRLSNCKSKGDPWPRNQSAAPKEYIVTDGVTGEKIKVTNDAEMANQQGIYWKMSVEKIVETCGPNDEDPVIERYKEKYIEAKNALPKEDPLHKEWEFKIPTYGDIVDLIDKSKPKASSSFDEISHRLVKKLKWHVAPILTRLFAKIVTTSEFPEVLHEIKLVAVHKSGKARNDCASYRPIAIQSTIAKLLDMFICQEITRITDKLEILSENIHGYRKMHSCATAIRQLLGAFDHAKANGLNLCVLGLDYSKAYDTISLTLCPKIMKALGGGPKAVSLLKNFLTGRPCRVVHNKAKSKAYRLISGILQGAATSPKLFSLITVDKEDLLKALCDGLIIYADDSLIYWYYEKTEEAKLQTMEKIKLAVETIEKWAKEVQLKLNLSKTELVCYSNCMKADCGLRCKIDEMEIFDRTVKSSSEFKFVGVYMTEKGGLDPHVRELRKKMDQQTSVLRRIQAGCSMTHKRTLFQGLVFSHVMTSASAYLPRLNKTQVNQLQSKVQKCLRTIAGVPLYDKYNFDGTLYSGSQTRLDWSIPSIDELKQEFTDVNAFANYNRHHFDCLDMTAHNKAGEPTSKRPKLDKYKSDSYVKTEFLAIKNNPAMNVDLKSVKEIKARHKLIRETKFGLYKERKKMKFSAIRIVKKAAMDGLTIDNAEDMIHERFGDLIYVKKLYRPERVELLFKDELILPYVCDDLFS